jgi:hypothetical protein
MRMHRKDVLTIGPFGEISKCLARNNPYTQSHFGPYTSLHWIIETLVYRYNHRSTGLLVIALRRTIPADKSRAFPFWNETIGDERKLGGVVQDSDNEERRTMWWPPLSETKEGVVLSRRECQPLIP